MNSHPAFGWGAPKEMGAGSGLNLDPTLPGLPLEGCFSSYFGTRSIISVQPGDHHHPAPLDNEGEGRVLAGAGVASRAPTEAVKPFLLSPVSSAKPHSRLWRLGTQEAAGTDATSQLKPLWDFLAPASLAPAHLVPPPWPGLPGQPLTVDWHWGSHGGRSHVPPAGHSHRWLG